MVLGAITVLWTNSSDKTLWLAALTYALNNSATAGTRDGWYVLSADGTANRIMGAWFYVATPTGMVASQSCLISLRPGAGRNLEGQRYYGVDIGKQIPIPPGASMCYIPILYNAGDNATNIYALVSAA
jgi:hypothetical protein